MDLAEQPAARQTDQVEPQEREPLSAARVAVRWLGVAAVVALVVAVVLNALWTTRFAPVQRSVAEASRRTTIAATKYQLPTLPDLGKPAIEMLVPTVISYETIARHPKPGAGSLQAEAIYVSLNMSLTESVPMEIYASADGFGSVEEAQERLEALKATYSFKGKDVTVAGQQKAYAGYTPSEDTWMVAWVKDTWVVYVKSFFLRTPPVVKEKDYLRNVASPVANATVVYQSTGKSGIEAVVPSGTVQ